MSADELEEKIYKQMNDVHTEFDYYIDHCTAEFPIGRERGDLFSLQVYINDSFL